MTFALSSCGGHLSFRTFISRREFFHVFMHQLEENMAWLNQAFHVDKNFDVVATASPLLQIKKACLYFIDGFTKDDSLKILQGFSSIKADDMPEDAHSFSKISLMGDRPYQTAGKMIIQLLFLCFVFLLMAITSVSLSTAVLTRPEVSANQKKTKLCVVPETVLWKLWCLTQLLSAAGYVTRS